MRKSIWRFLLCLFFTGLYSEAEGLYEKNQLGVLHFRQAQLESYLSVNASTLVNYWDDITVNGVTTSNSTKNSSQSGLTYNIGITDWLQFGLNENYLYGSEADTTPVSTGVASETTSKGLASPTASLNFRIFGGLQGDQFGSLNLSVTPSFGGHQNASTTRQGDNMTSATSMTLTPTLYLVKNKDEFSIGPYLQYVFQGTNKDEKPDNSSTTDPYMSYGIDFTYRYHVSRGFFSQFGMGVAMPYSVTVTYPNRTVDNFTDIAATATLTLGFLITNSMLISTSINYTTYETTLSSSTGTSSNHNIDQDSSVITMAFAF